MKIPRHRFLGLAARAAALPAVSRIAWAQTYPTRPAPHSSEAIMKFVAMTAVALVWGTPGLAQNLDHIRSAASPKRLAVSPQLAAAPVAAPTARDAEDFIAKVEADLVVEDEYASRVNWIAATFITDDTKWLSAKVSAERGTLAVARAKQAAGFDRVTVDPVTRRKLEILKKALSLPAPDRPGASEEMAKIKVDLKTIYSTGKVTYQGKLLTLDDVVDLMRSSRDPAELKALWEGWHAIARPMRNDYRRLVGLANEGARELGYADTGVLWRSWYDMPPDEFAQTVERLWTQLEPLYKNLQCYARTRLNEKYGDTVQPRTGAIRADLLGDMWAQSWGNIYDLLAPKNADLGYDLTPSLVKQNYDAVKLARTAENFYTSIGFTPLPETFWSRSMLVRPRDREVDCHASAWDIDEKNDVRVKACFRVNADDFFTAHHELGHNFYQRAYQDQATLFKYGANDGFHEAVGDFAGLNALTPNYLKQLGLIDKVPGPEADIPYLLRMALDKVAFLPFAVIVDKWRWQVFAGETTPDRYNDSWWALRTKYQGIVPPVSRPSDAFDPGAKMHIASNIPYTRYFLADIYEFQFYRAACRLAGWSGPVNRCTIYGNKEVGARFQEMLRMGSSKPWPDALEAFTGERTLDASAVADYFAPLDRWLTDRNTGEKCGW
jgi:peptidyl-dipeptidase A